MFSLEEILNEFVEASVIPRLPKVKVGDLLHDYRFDKAYRSNRQKKLVRISQSLKVNYEIKTTSVVSSICSCGGYWETRPGTNRSYHIARNINCNKPQYIQLFK